MKLSEEMSYVVDEAQNIKVRLKDIEEGREKEMPLSAIAQDLADLGCACAKLKIKILARKILC